MAVPGAGAGGGCVTASKDGFAAIGPTCFCVARACSFFGGTAAIGPSCFCCFFGGLRVQTTCPSPQGSQFWPDPFSPGGHCLQWPMLLSAEANTGTESKLHEVHFPVTVFEVFGLNACRHALGGGLVDVGALSADGHLHEIAIHFVFPAHRLHELSRGAAARLRLDLGAVGAVVGRIARHRLQAHIVGADGLAERPPTGRAGPCIVERPHAVAVGACVQGLAVGGGLRLQDAAVIAEPVSASGRVLVNLVGCPLPEQALCDAGVGGAIGAVVVAEPEARKDGVHDPSDDVAKDLYALGQGFGTALDHVAGELGGIGQEFGAAGDVPHICVHDLLDLVIEPCDLAAARHVVEEQRHWLELAGKLGEGHRGVAVREGLQLALDRREERCVGRRGGEQGLRHLLADRAVDHAHALLGIGECSAGAQCRDHPDGRDHRRVAACGLADALRSLRGVLYGLLELRRRHGLDAVHDIRLRRYGQGKYRECCACETEQS